jgi:glycosyltransferase involved in cell wall biosynthesis
MARVSRGIVLGESLKDEFRPWLPDTGIAVVPNGIEIPTARPRRVVSPLAGDCKVVFLGNLLKFKGVTVFIEAAARALELTPYLHVRLAGRWTDDPVYKRSAAEIRSECMNLVRRSPKPEAFEFMGEIDRKQVATLLHDADLLVLPSQEEGLPLVILEAMAACVAVISSAGVGAIPEVVLHGETGLLVPVGDPVALALAISRLASDSDLRMKLAAAGRERCIREYSLSAWEDRLDRELRAALVGGTRSCAN